MSKNHPLYPSLSLSLSLKREMTERKENIVMFPFMAQGHIIPFLALALELEKKNGYTIIFVNTRLNIKKLRPSIPPNSSIRLLEIPFNSSDHGLLRTPKTPTLFLSLSSCTSSSSLPLSSPPSETSSPASSSNMAAHHFALFPTCSSDGHRIHTKQLPEHFQVAVPGDSWCSFSQDMFRDWLESDGILFNTIEEIDHVGMEYFRQQIGCSVWPVGPILSSLGSKARAGDDAEVTMHLCMKWLDSKPVNSVLYVAFGSQSAPSPSQTIQLAMALEACGKNFIWVVRPPSNSVTDHDHNDGEWLPRGFERRIQDSNKGLLVQQWAPQLEILSHKSLCVFLTHCGWNSVLEALRSGVPMLSWPMGAEQNFNAKMLEEEMGLCVGVASGSSEVNHKDIVKKIDLVMGGSTKAKDMKNKACEVMEMLNNAKNDEKGFKGSSAKAMEDFLYAALSKSCNY
ncbi:UDP-glycosyltransferase 92A1 [Camellia lanceoleosa]|uniref:UDP-glycosyltransferase 92A1 n=1 Tax=Camellia lanceoleosa TaxID=1840588 RepID=A0ACC0F5C3_9ERIC|nr:UDP-glycosyltransferase 92A1 [Camellia lanceoleosa]